MMTPYCYPEQISSSHLTEDLYEAFSQNGIEVINYVPTPTRGVDKVVRNKYKRIKYEERHNGAIKIHRFPMFKEGKNPLFRAIRYVLVNVIQYFKGINAKEVDVVYGASTPPTQGVLCALVAKKLSRKYHRKVPFVYCLQDIFPDSLVNAKMTKKGSVIWKIGRKIENYTYKSASKIIVISESFKKNIIEKGVSEKKIVVIPNWIDTNSVYPIDRKDNVLFDRYNLDRSKFYICYSGNIGHSQNLGLLYKAAIRLQKEMPDVCFVLIGEGAAKEKFETKIKEKGLTNIILLPFQPYEDIAHVFSLGDVGLIISKPGVGNSSVPSKTWSIMAAGRPIIASFDKNTELSMIIDSVSCGVMTSTSDHNKLANDIMKIKNSQRLAELGNRGRKHVCNNLSKEICTRKYIGVLDKII